MSLPAGQPVTHGRITYEVVRPGCATYWENCPHGEHAITVQRIGRNYGTECLDERECE